MTRSPGQHAARVLIVGDDAEVGAVLHLHLPRAGWAPVCLPGPELLESVWPAVSPHAIVLILPSTPAASWGPALTSVATAARLGVRVVLVAPAREVVEPLASVAGAERAMSRADVLARPLSVLDSSSGMLTPPPLPLRPSASAATTPAPPATSAPPPSTSTTPGTPASLALGGTPGPVAPAGTPGPIAPAATPQPKTLSSTTAPPSPRTAGTELTPTSSTSSSRTAAIDLLALIDEELVDEPRQRPRITRVDVNVTLVSEHNFFVGVTRRVDSGGVFISTMLPPPVGTPIEVRLGLPDARKVDLQGEVAFIRDRNATGGRQPAGCGVKLRSVPAWAAEAIDRFLAARPPIVYTP